MVIGGLFGLGKATWGFKGGVNSTITFFPGRCQVAKLRERLGGVDSKLGIFSEYPFLKVTGQGHSFFQILCLTFGTLLLCNNDILTGFGRRWVGGESQSRPGQIICLC